jgi:hypothetical protein
LQQLLLPLNYLSQGIVRFFTAIPSFFPHPSSAE